MMRLNLIIAAALAILIGCTPTPEQKRALQTNEDISATLTSYRCTDPQMQKAEHESGWCNDNTSFSSAYCYSSAITRNCTSAPGAATGASQ